jgi:hypothetical protein
MFLARLSKPFVFDTQVVQGSIGRLIKLVQKLNVGNWIGHLLVGLQAHYPIFLRLRKSGSPAPEVHAVSRSGGIA